MHTCVATLVTSYSAARTYIAIASETNRETNMSGKIMTAVAAAILLASTGLAFAQTQAPRHEWAANGYIGYYNMVPNQYAAPNDGWNIDQYPFPVTGQSY